MKRIGKGKLWLLVPAALVATLIGVAPAQAQAKKPIKMMVISNIGAAGSNFPGTWEMANQAAKTITKNGGINGRPLEVTLCNPKLDNNEAERCARNAVSGDYVGVVGGYAGGNSARVTPVLEAAKMACIGCIQVGASDLVSKVYFTPYPSSAALFMLLGDEVFHNCKKAVVFRSDVAAAAITIQFTQAGIKASGGDPNMISAVALPLAAADLSPQVEQVFKKNPDCLVSGTTDEIGLQFMNAAKKLGYKGFTVFGNPTNVTDTSWDTLGGKNGPYEGAKLASSIAGYDNSAWNPYEADVKTVNKKATVVQANAMYSRTSWLSVNLAAGLLKSIKGDITKQSLFDAARKTTNANTFLNNAGRGKLGNLVPPNVDFTKAFNVPSFARSYTRLIYPVKLVGGRFISDGSPFDASIPLRTALGG